VLYRVLFGIPLGLIATRQGTDQITNNQYLSFPQWHKTKAIDQLFLYAVHREQRGDTNIFDAILRLRKREFDDFGSHYLLWRLSVSEVFARASPRAAVLSGRYLCWRQEQSADAQNLISKWLAGISVVPHTEELAESVVDTLLQIAANPHLRPSIPADIWSWLNERPSLSFTCRGRSSAGDSDIVRTVRGLNNVGVLTSYLILVWSGSGSLNSNNFAEIRASFREDFNGVGMGDHRVELIQQLGLCISGESDERSERLDLDLDLDLEDNELQDNEESLQYQRARYIELKRILQQVDQEATKILDRAPAISKCRFYLFDRKKRG